MSCKKIPKKFRPIATKTEQTTKDLFLKIKNLNFDANMNIILGNVL